MPQRMIELTRAVNDRPLWIRPDNIIAMEEVLDDAGLFVSTKLYTSGDGGFFNVKESPTMILETAKRQFAGLS